MEQGLSVPSSDVDIVICDVLDHYRAVLSGIKPKHTCTELLAAKLGQQVWVQTVRAIEATAVPVIKVSALPTGAVDSIRLDISFDAPSHRYYWLSIQGHRHTSCSLPRPCCAHHLLDCIV